LSIFSKTRSSPLWSPGSKAAPPLIEPMRSRPSVGLPSAMLTQKRAKQQKHDDD